MIGLILVLVVIGFLLWLLQNKIPMDSTIKTVITAVVVLCTVIWLLNVFGVSGPPVPRLR